VIDFPSNPIPNETTINVGGKSWLCVGISAAGDAIWDLTSVPGDVVFGDPAAPPVPAPEDEPQPGPTPDPFAPVFPGGP